MNRILVVEDEPAIQEALAYALTNAGYDVDTVGDGDAAVAAARGRPYDLMILDLLLPGRDGVDVCRAVRAESDLPIVMLTALDHEEDVVGGLDAGADDYLTKPFAMTELVSRVRAQLRRRRLDRRGTRTSVGALELDPARHAATLAGRPLRLTRSEFRIVALLASAPGRVFTREELATELREGASSADARAIDVHVSNLRRKLEDDPRRPRRLVTVRGAGYRLEPG